MTGATSHAERRGWCEWHGSLLHMSCSVAHTRAVHTDGLLMHTVLFWFEPLADVSIEAFRIALASGHRTASVRQPGLGTAAAGSRERRAFS